MKELIERIFAETPLFFKKIRVIGLGLVAVATYLLSAPADINLPAIVIKYAGHLMTAGFIMTAVAQFTKK